MNISRGNEVVLMTEYPKLTVGETYEVANITDTSIVLRECTSKIAVASVNIDDFEIYFTKKSEVKGWTKWTPLLDNSGACLGMYRTNQKRVQFKTNGISSIKAQASCNNGEDVFDLRVGLNIAYARCRIKTLKEQKKIHEDILRDIRKEIGDCKSMIMNIVNEL